MNDTLRVGFVGLGGISRQRHVPGLKRIPGVEIAAVANRGRASSERAAAEFGIPEICEDWRELVARPDLQAVFIGTWPYMHREISLAALDAGKHVFCQARMAMNAAEALEMVRRARALDLVAALCPVPFGLKYDRAVERMLREGELGDVRLVQAASLCGAYADPATPMDWRKDHRLSGLNDLHTLGMYVEVMHRWFGWTADASAQTPDLRAPSGSTRRARALRCGSRTKSSSPPGNATGSRSSMRSARSHSIRSTASRSTDPRRRCATTWRRM